MESAEKGMVVTVLGIQPPGVEVREAKKPPRD